MPTKQKSWTSDEVVVSGLFLDAENPRLSITPGSNPSQADLLADLLANENVEEIAASMADAGIYPHESLIAVKERVAGKQSLVVVEGNRRLAAMKALVSADAVPQAHRKKYRLLAKKAGFAVDVKLPVVVAPSRVAAMPIIVARHTHNQIRKWPHTAQAAYFNRMRDQKFTVEEIAGMTGLSEAEVLAPLRTHALYAAACQLDLESGVAEAVRNPRKFPITTLKRVFDSSVMLDALGAQFEGERLTGKIHEDEFEKGFTRIVSDLAQGQESSRTLSTARDFKSYLRRMGADKPDIDHKGGFSLDRTGEIGSAGKGGSKKKKKTTARKGTSRRGKRKTKNVIPRDFKPIDSGTRIQKVCEELRGLDLDAYPNASALLLRSLIDLCVTEYMEATGAAAECIKKFREKDNKPRGWSPTLRQSLQFLLQEYELGLSDQALTAARRFAQRGHDGLCLDSLDKFTHNAYTPPTPTELRAIWTHIEPTMKVLVAPAE